MWFRELANPIAKRFGHYTAYQLNESEHVGDWVTDSPEGDLRAVGYEPAPTLAGIPLEAAKWHWDDRGKTPKVALRKVDPNDERFQYHVHVFGAWQTSEPWQVASHRELRPDVCRLSGETLGDVRQRLRDHYRANEYYQGRICDGLAEVLGENK